MKEDTMVSDVVIARERFGGGGGADRVAFCLFSGNPLTGIAKCGIIPNILGYRQVGKAQDFDSCIRWFESSYPSQKKALAEASAFFNEAR